MMPEGCFASGGGGGNGGAIALAAQQEEQRQRSERTPPTAEAGPLARVAWYGSEALGKAVAALRPRSADAGDGGEYDAGVPSPLTRDDAKRLLRRDYDHTYFVTGDMTMGIYEDQCEFADPFVSFRGRRRFKQNVSNLGSFMEEVDLAVLDWQETEDTITTKWRFRCTLGLPWRPILAACAVDFLLRRISASGSTKHYFDMDSGKIYKHVESWNISPWDGVRQLFKPNPRPRGKASK
eukprot:SM000030S11413  [mRNA]  locus=s30:584124:586102:- [translate_table: standard]